jgi:alcohol dehydrogenase
MGFGASEQIGAKCSELGIKKVILVTDAGVEKAGLTKGIEKSLTDVGIEFVVFRDVVPDPTDVSIIAAGDVARAAKVEAVIGIGGGSALDTAKGVNVLMGNPSPLSDYYLGGKPTQPGLPLFLLPTTGGTGSESTISAVITDTTQKRKTAIRSKNCNVSTLAIIDPGLQMGMPLFLTALTGIDAFAHSAESLTVNKPNPICDALGKESLRFLVQYLPRAINDGSDKEAREHVAYAATLGGMCIANTLVHYGHCFGHSIGAKLHLPHGLGVGHAVAQAINYVADAIPEQVRQVGIAMGVDLSGCATGEAIGRKVGEAIIKFKADIKLPTLKESGATREQVLSAAPLVLRDGCYPFAAKPMTDEMVKIYLDKIYDNVL